VKPVFEILEHTADIGLRVRGATLADLFVNAALGLQSLALDMDQVEPSIPYPIDVTAEDLEALLVNWLNEIIYVLDGMHVALSRLYIFEISETHVKGGGWGEPRYPQRHPPRLVVKAATYHQLKIDREPEGWTAEVFFDI
jgi:SHS2 domain-containing protein